MSTLTLIYDTFVQFVSEHRVVVIIVLAFLAKYFVGKSQKPLKEIEESRVVSISSIEEWINFVETTSEEESLSVVDFYATWCPPCVRAAPEYSALSIEYPNVRFYKVDTDQASAVARDNGIRSMPTFIVFKKGKAIKTMTGFNKLELKSIIQLHSPSSNVTPVDK